MIVQAPLSVAQSTTSGYEPLDGPLAEELSLQRQKNLMSQVQGWNIEAIAQGLAEEHGYFFECGGKSLLDIDDDMYHHSGNRPVFMALFVFLERLFYHWTDSLRDEEWVSEYAADKGDRGLVKQSWEDCKVYFSEVWGL